MQRTESKPEFEQIESAHQPIPEGLEHATVLKSRYDDLGLLATAWKFKKTMPKGRSNIIANQGFINQLGFPNAAGVYTLNANYTALWGAMQSLGQLIGMVLLNPVSDRIGRKYTLYMLWLILLGSILIESFTTNWQQWAGAKLLAGAGVGCIQATLPIYVTEWSPANIRGAMISAYGVWNQFGVFLAPLLLYLVQQGDPLGWRIPVYTQFAFLGLMAPIFLYLPESPSYFAAKDQDERGKASLRRVNGGIEGYDVDAEYAIIKNIILEERAGRAQLGLDREMTWRELAKSYAECFKGSNARRTLGSALPACAQQLTGLSFLSTYASLFFKQSGFSNAFLITTIITSIKVFAILILVFTTDRFGRRPYVFSMAVLCSAMMLLVGILGQLPQTTALRDVLILAACLWSYGSAILGALGWTFVGEVSAQKLRARTAGIAAGMSVIFGLTFNTALPVMLDVNGANWGYKTAWLFFGTSVATIVLIWFFLPETAKRNAAELDEMYEAGVPAWRMKHYGTEVQKVQQARVRAAM